MKLHGYIDPSYAAYTPYAYGDYTGAYPGLDPYSYGGYYGCYDYFNAAAAAANSNTAAGGYGKLIHILKCYCSAVPPKCISDGDSGMWR